MRCFSIKFSTNWASCTDDPTIPSPTTAVSGKEQSLSHLADFKAFVYKECKVCFCWGVKKDFPSRVRKGNTRRDKVINLRLAKGALSFKTNKSFTAWKICFSNRAKESACAWLKIFSACALRFLLQAFNWATESCCHLLMRASFSLRHSSTWAVSYLPEPIIWLAWAFKSALAWAARSFTWASWAFFCAAVSLVSSVLKVAKASLAVLEEKVLFGFNKPSIWVKRALSLSLRRPWSIL